MARREQFQTCVRSAKERAAACVMGVCNVTPDSFSDGGDAFGQAAARARIDLLLAEGAHVIDIGGESTRPGAPPIAPHEQLDRVMPAISYALSKGAIVSVDTADAHVAREALSAGAHALNDVSCMKDEALASIVAEFDAAYVLMHARGTQTEMRGFGEYPDDGYPDVVRNVASEWMHAAERAVSLGVLRTALYMDPGLGFAKNAKHSMTLLACTKALRGLTGAPLCIGASRKSFLKEVDSEAAPKERTGASLMAAAFAVREGADIVRVHDARSTLQALAMDRMLGTMSHSAATKGGA